MRILSGACLLFLAAHSFAQIEKLELPAEDKPDEKQGWRFVLDLAGTESWTTDENVPAVTNGHHISLGLKISAKADLHEAPHEWRNRLTLLETYTRTPPISQFLKAADQLTLMSEYLYLLHRMGGLFVRAHLEAPLFPGEDVRAKEVTYRIRNISGDVTTVKAEHLDLTTAFSPLKLKQSTGAFVRLHNDKNLLWEIEAGFMAREVIAFGQRVVEKKGDDTIRIKTLADYYQFGPTATMTLEGELVDKRVTYKAALEAFYVAFRQSEESLASTFVDRFNYDADAEISIKIVDWLWLSFEEKLVMQPDFSKDLQVMSQLFLNFKYVF